MNAWLIGLIGVVYTIVAIQFIMKGQVGMGISFLGYALGNVGLVMVTLTAFIIPVKRYYYYFKKYFRLFI